MKNGRLTPRELEVLALVARGKVDKDIAAALKISRSTLRSHMAAIFLKTEADNRTAAARWYLSNVGEADGG